MWRRALLCLMILLMAAGGGRRFRPGGAPGGPPPVPVAQAPPATGSSLKPGDVEARLRALDPRIAKVTSYGKSNEGRELWVVTLSGAGNPDDKPGVLYVAGFRGNDGLAIGAALDFARSLVDAAADEKTRAVLDTHTLYIVPLANPDGAEKGQAYLTRDYAWGYDSKAGDGSDPAAGDSDAGGGTRTSIDLLQNFASGWKPELARGASGPFPMSEPESKALADFITNHPNLVLGFQLYGTGSNFLEVLSRRAGGAVAEPDDLTVLAAIGKTFEDGLSTPTAAVKTGTLASDLAPDSEKDNAFLDWTYQNWQMYAADVGVKDAPPEKLLPLLRDAAQFTPALTLEDPKVEDLGDKFYRITVTIKNTGKVPTLSKSGRGQNPPHPVVTWLDLPPGVSLTAGSQRRKIDPLEVGKEEATTWVVRGAAGASISVTAWAAKAGKYTRTFALKATAPTAKEAAKPAGQGVSP